MASRNVANPMSVQWFGDTFVSVTKENEWWGSRLRIDRAPAPQGPWTMVEQRTVSGDMKCSTCGNYGAFLMPWLDQQGRMIVALSSGGDFNLWRSNAWLYRPTFYSFDVPAASPPLARPRHRRSPLARQTRVSSPSTPCAWSTRANPASPSPR